MSEDIKITNDISPDLSDSENKIIINPADIHYDPTPWQDGGGAALCADNLNKIEEGLRKILCKDGSLGYVNILIDSINAEIGYRVDDNTKIKNSFDSVTSKIDSNSEEISNLDTRIETLEGKLNLEISRVDDLTSDFSKQITSINERLDKIKEFDELVLYCGDADEIAFTSNNEEAPV